MNDSTARLAMGTAIVVAATIVPIHVCSADEPTYDPIERYQPQELEGWKLLVNRGLLEGDPALAERTLLHLRQHLYQIRRVVDSGPLDKLRKIPIWIEMDEPHHPCMCYHPERDWLSDHNMNPEKAGAVEIANCRNFLVWTHDQPWMVLHELAHGYHHQFLEDGFKNRDVAEAFRRATDSGKYQSVLRISGRREKSYAMTNPMEYFAEASEAYFGTNDFFPFVRSELQDHDSDGFQLLEKIWGKPRREDGDKP